MAQDSSSNNNSSQSKVSEAAQQAALNGLNAGVNELTKEDSTGKDIAKAVGGAIGGTLASAVTTATGVGVGFTPVAGAAGGILGAKLGEYFYNKINELGKSSLEHRKETGKFMSTTQSALAGFALGGGPVGALMGVVLNEATAKRPQSVPATKNNAGQFRDDTKRDIVLKMSSSDTIGSQSITTSNNNHTKSQGKG
jgi:hypothetical protein